VAGTSERQGRICFEKCRRMVELQPLLAERVQVFQDRLYMPHHGASLFPLPADADAILGVGPSFTVVDELGVVDADVFEAMRLASGKRPESTLLAIGTPPREPDSVMHTLVEHGRFGDDPTFALIEYAAPEGCAVDDPKAWKAANPALGDFLFEDVFTTEARTVRESVFRQFRLGQQPTTSICGSGPTVHDTTAVASPLKLPSRASTLRVDVATRRSGAAHAIHISTGIHASSAWLTHDERVTAENAENFAATQRAEAERLERERREFERERQAARKEVDKWRRPLSGNGEVSVPGAEQGWARA
jgi:hypothetical protein